MLLIIRLFTAVENLHLLLVTDGYIRFF